jgi:uncharacterized protein YkwD
MRTSLGVLVLLAAALLVAPLPAATSAPAGDADRVASHHSVRVVTLKDKVIRLVNNKRAAHGCGAVEKNGALGRAAQRHTKRMADANTLSHQLAGEAYFATRIRRAGYHGSPVGENIAFGPTTAAGVMRAWMHSAPHRRNILKCAYTHIGVGFARSAAGAAYWTQDFGG